MNAELVPSVRSDSRSAITPIKGRVLQRTCACGQHTSAGGECEECKQKREGTLQRAAINPSPVHAVPPIVHEVLRSPGQPLDAATRAFMEPRFGHDFSGVPVKDQIAQRSPSSNLTVGPADDVYENEANWHASRITAQSQAATPMD